MTKVAILIPCHIQYEGQKDLLDNCILSLLKQTLKPKSIYISISFENKYKMDVKSILQKYVRTTNPKINFKISKEKKHQMEHLHNIVSNIDVNDYDMLMFCDDDDTYHIERVNYFVEAFNSGKNNINGILDNNKEDANFGGVREHVKLTGVSAWSDIPEYWCYGIVPSAIVEFFSFFQGKDFIFLHHKFGDTYLRHYLRKNSKYSKWIGIQDAGLGFTLYNYNKNNPNSICGKIESHIGNPYDNLLLRVIDCRSENHFNDIIKKNEKIYNIDYKLESVLKYIYHLCKRLYK